MKVIDKKDTIYQISKKYPEIVEVLKEVGFTQISEPQMIATVGRFMTIEKGCQMRGFSLEEVIEKLEKAGYSWEDIHE
ncbi:MAG TPA: hypothetical protein DEA51_02860 [Erysipelotrichaceae bacterium]|nr:hypothetical protein [Erysipelotrichaceae bacterium]